jgi:hypothetical protein
MESWRPWNCRRMWKDRDAWRFTAAFISLAIQDFSTVQTLSNSENYNNHATNSWSTQVSISVTSPNSNEKQIISLEMGMVGSMSMSLLWHSVHLMMAMFFHPYNNESTRP